MDLPKVPQITFDFCKKYAIIVTSAKTLFFFPENMLLPLVLFLGTKFQQS